MYGLIDDVQVDELGIDIGAVDDIFGDEIDTVREVVFSGTPIVIDADEVIARAIGGQL